MFNIDKKSMFVIMLSMEKITTKKQTPVRKDMYQAAPMQPLPMDSMQQLVAMQKMMQKMFLIIIVLVVAVGGILVKDLVLNKNAATTTTTAATTTAGQPAQQTYTIDQIKAVFNKATVKFGDTGKKVVFIEGTDPSCPYCHVASGKNPTLNAQMGDRFKLVSEGGTYVAPVMEMEKLVKDNKAGMAIIYTPGHGNGEMGMKALYCANEAGKYWEAQDLMYSAAGYELLNTTVKNDKTKSQEVADFLSSVVDPTQIKNCIDSGKYDSKLIEDTKLASSIGINGTPGFFVNTTAFAGAYSYKDMESAVNAAL